MGKDETPTNPTNELVSVAVFNGSDSVAREIIERELSAEGIIHYIEGSTSYNVLVSERDAVRARDTLRRSEALKTRWHQLIE